jgi:hypothetical protein
MKRFHAPFALALALVPAVGCDFVARVAANESAVVASRASRALESHWDPVLVGRGLPGTILQLEGLYAVVPENEGLGLQLAQAYASYSYGWLEDEAQDAEARGDFEAQSEIQGRIRHLNERARNIALHHLRRRDSGIDAAIAAGPEALSAYLTTHFRSPGDAEILFWVGYPWAGAIQASQGDPALVLDLPTARAFVERAVALDEGVFHHGGLTMLAALQASLPVEMGGDPGQGREMFERALQVTHRQFFAVQLTYAQTYAVSTQDRALFITLLREVIDGGDPDPSVRLANRISRNKAIRLLRRVDQLFVQ